MHKVAKTMFVGLILLAASATGVFAEDYEVSRAGFVATIVNREPGRRLGLDRPAAPGPVWFWSEIKVSGAGIARLRKQGRLPLQHRWYLDIGGSAGSDLRPDFVRPLEEITGDKRDKLQFEGAQRGFFTYRTSSCRIAIPAGIWVVKITDAFGATLDCGDGRSCRFEVAVRAGGDPAVAPCVGD